MSLERGAHRQDIHVTRQGGRQQAARIGVPGHDVQLGIALQRFRQKLRVNARAVRNHYANRSFRMRGLGLHVNRRKNWEIVLAEGNSGPRSSGLLSEKRQFVLFGGQKQNPRSRDDSSTSVRVYRNAVAGTSVG